MKRFPDPTTPEAQQIKKDFIEGYNLNMAIQWTAASAVSSTPSSTRTRPGCCYVSRCAYYGTSSCGSASAASTA